MKALVISDIHSNIVSIKKILRVESDVDIIYCAGDFVDYGPYPEQVIAWAIENRVVAVKGNHDIEAIERYYSGIRLEDIPIEKRAWIDYNISRLERKHIQYLEALPEEIFFNLDGISYLLKHSLIENSYQTVSNIVEFDRLWSATNTNATSKNYSERRIIFGHTHEAAIHYVDNASLWLNPGSVSYRNVRQQSDLSQDAHYMTIVDGKMEMKRIGYDCTPLYVAMKAWQVKSSQSSQAERFYGK